MAPSEPKPGREPAPTTRRLPVSTWLLIALGALTLAVAAHDHWTRYQMSRLLPSKHSLSILVPEDAQRRFLDEVRTFASSRAFDVHMQPVSPDGRRWSIWLERSDIAISVINPLSNEEFHLDFHERAGSEDERKTATLVVELERAMLALPGVKRVPRP